MTVEMARRVKREGHDGCAADRPGEFESAATVREERLIEPFSFTERIASSPGATRPHAGGSALDREAALFGPCILIPTRTPPIGTGKNAEEFCATGAGVWMPQDRPRKRSSRR